MTDSVGEGIARAIIYFVLVVPDLSLLVISLLATKSLKWGRNLGTGGSEKNRVIALLQAALTRCRALH